MISLKRKFNYSWFFILLVLVSCSSKIDGSKDEVYRWTGLVLNEDFSNLVYSLDIPNSNLVNGLLIMKAEVSEQAFKKFLFDYQFRNVSFSDRFYVPTDQSLGETWWMPGSRRMSDWYIKPVKEGVFRQQAFWDGRHMYLFQNGPFEK